MTSSRSAFSATITVALKGLSKDVRERLNDKNWMVKEGAEHEVSLVIEDAISRAFLVSLKPVDMENRYPGAAT